MIVHVDGDGRVSLTDAADFRRFKVAVAVPAARYAEIAPSARPAVTFDDPGTAWVSIAWLRALPGVAGDSAWQDGLTAMIEKAAPHGWISVDGGAVKAHVEWTG